MFVNLLIASAGNAHNSQLKTYLRYTMYTEYDWEASHFSKVAANESHNQSLPLHHDDVIIKAVPVKQHNEQEQVHTCTYIVYIVCKLAWNHVDCV